MPTPGGLPRRGEVWELDIAIPGQPRPAARQAVVLERTPGDYWGLRVYVRGAGRKLWADAPYWLAQGWLTYVGQAGPETRRKLGLRPG